jgi:hypothetical protein
MKKYKINRYDIVIRINGIKLDQVRLPLTDHRDTNGRITKEYLSLGYNLNARIVDNVLCILLSPKIVVELYRSGILKPNENEEYQIEILDWSEKCRLANIIYGNSRDTWKEDIALLFVVLSANNDRIRALEKIIGMVE